MHVSKGVPPTYFSNISFKDASFTRKIEMPNPSHGMELVIDDGSVLNKGAGTITPYMKHLDVT